jgi:hypothetical protein
MFPPPRPWTQRASVEPEREYQAFTSRFFLKSMIRVPAFLASSFRIMKQANTAPGIIGWALGIDILRREFYTLSAWKDAESLRRFVRDGSHKDALQLFEKDLRRKTILVYYKVLGHDLPLTWKDAIARQERRESERAAVS